MTKAPSVCKNCGGGSIERRSLTRRIASGGIYVHITKPETLEEAYRAAKGSGGAAGIDGQTFEDIERTGRPEFLATVREELITGRYKTAG